MSSQNCESDVRQRYPALQSLEEETATGMWCLMSTLNSISCYFAPNQTFTAITHTHTRLTALFRDYPGEPVRER